MIEWENRFNPFNSIKVLRHWDRLVGCANENYLTPLTINIDPTNKCNLNCCFCNSDKIVKTSQETMTEEHMLDIADMIGSWGKDSIIGSPKSVYISGGGEPMMNPGTPSLIERLAENRIQSAIITNGAFLNAINMPIILKHCRWIGISVDATCNKTYNLMKGLPEQSTLFDSVIDNIKKLVWMKEKLNSKCDIGFKFLLHPYNFREIWGAAHSAKSLGVNDFHLRPVRYVNFDKIDEKSIDFKENLNFINDQFYAVQKLNSDTFHVYGIRHKFNPDLSIKKNFRKCRAIALEPTFSADGNVYLCFDQRANKDMILCKHSPDVNEIKKIWNSEFHRRMIRKIDVEKCPACTFSAYNEAIEQVVMKDQMCINFL